MKLKKKNGVILLDRERETPGARPNFVLNVIDITMRFAVLLRQRTGHKIEEVFGLFLVGSPHVLATALVRMFLQQWILRKIVEHSGKRN